MPSRLIRSVHICAVPRHVTGPREGLATDRAGVRAVTDVGKLVCREIAGLREGLAAGGADIGAVAGMGAHVCR